MHSLIEVNLVDLVAEMVAFLFDVASCLVSEGEHVFTWNGFQAALCTPMPTPSRMTLCCKEDMRPPADAAVAGAVGVLGAEAHRWRRVGV